MTQQIVIIRQSFNFPRSVIRPLRAARRESVNASGINLEI
jgi:hypothetical protein